MYRILFFLILLLIVSCNSSDIREDNNTESSKKISEIVTEDSLSMESYYENETELEEPKEVTIEDLPAVWLKLTDNSDVNESDTDEGYCIYYWCNAELPQIWIEPGKGDDWYLSVLYGQDSDQWLIKSFEATESEQELYIVVTGSFDLIPVYDYQEKKKVTFWWNKDISFASFDGVYYESTFFVPEEEKLNYEEYSEDCEGQCEGP